MRVDLFLIRSVHYFRNESTAVLLGIASSSRLCVAGRLSLQAILALSLRDTTARLSLGAVVCVRVDLFLICSVEYFRNKSAAVPLGMASSSRLCVAGYLSLRRSRFIFARHDSADVFGIRRLCACAFIFDLFRSVFPERERSGAAWHGQQ